MSSSSLTGTVGRAAPFDRDRDYDATANSTGPQTPVMVPRLGSVVIAYSDEFERRFRLIVNAGSNDLERGRRRAVGDSFLSRPFGSVKGEGRPRSP
jgi:hypothetical protein